MDDYLDQFCEDHLNSGYGDILDQLADEVPDEYPDLDFDEPWDETLAQQELEDFEQADEYFGFYGEDQDSVSDTGIKAAQATTTRRNKMIMSQANPKFTLGVRIVATPAALEALEDSGQLAHEFLTRHLRLEQGDLCDEDHELNKQSIQDGSRLLSSFHTAKEVKVWIITEAEDDCGQRAATTILLPEEY